MDNLLDRNITRPWVYARFFQFPMDSTYELTWLGFGLPTTNKYIQTTIESRCWHNFSSFLWHDNFTALCPCCTWESFALIRLSKLLFICIALAFNLCCKSRVSPQPYLKTETESETSSHILRLKTEIQKTFWVQSPNKINRWRTYFNMKLPRQANRPKYQ